MKCASLLLWDYMGARALNGDMHSKEQAMPCFKCVLFHDKVVLLIQTVKSECVLNVFCSTQGVGCVGCVFQCTSLHSVSVVTEIWGPEETLEKLEWEQYELDPRPCREDQCH